MSEFWLSKKKYFCKYCDIYIADDAPSRQQHENGLRHKGSVERFIRGLYKGSERRKKELEEEKRDMARVEMAAQAAYSQDVASGLARPTASVASSSKAPAQGPKSTIKPSNPYTNYSTAESLGYTDPDAERIAAELERRRTQGSVGEWEVVSTVSAPKTRTNAGVDDETEAGQSEENDQLNTLESQAGVKREAEAPPEDEDGRSFKLRRKTLGTTLGDIYDPGVLSIKTRRKEPNQLPPAVASITSSEKPVASSVALPKWTTLQLKKPDDNAGPDQSSGPTSLQSSASKWAKIPQSAPQEVIKSEGVDFSDAQYDVPNTENLSNEDKTDSETTICKVEDTEGPLDAVSSGGSMFRKRKIPARTGKRT